MFQKKKRKTHRLINWLAGNDQESDATLLCRRNFDFISVLLEHYASEDNVSEQKINFNGNVGKYERTRTELSRACSPSCKWAIPFPSNAYMKALSSSGTL
jgi:hypothetical protein